MLSQGILEQLRVSPETIRMLKHRGVPVHVRQTEDAVRLYNELRENQPVGGLFHSTC